MIINRVREEESGRSGDEQPRYLEGNSNEYQTADELFELMAKNRTFDGDGDKALSTRDLVILYENIDTKLISNCNEQTSKSSNQYVETVIYNDDQGSEVSDVSENISYEDLNDIFAINKERIDFLNNVGDSLCHKFGNIDMQKSNLTTEYDRHFLFNDPCLKEQQLKCFHCLSKSNLSDSTVFPASLLDYICCKRLENNYNFYMDNIIKHVQHTIEQLKRISNGDYLTEKAKEKWREVDGGQSQQSDCKKTVLTSSTSIPLHVEGKHSGHKSTWDDIVHSEMDVRSLSKILEKKIVVEVPKILCGSYRLFSKRCKDNLIITCKKDKQPLDHEIKEESRVDVVLKLKRSKSGHVISNIDSIMILKSLPSFPAKTELSSDKLLALEFDQVNLEQKIEPNSKIMELDEDEKEIAQSHAVILDREAEEDKLSESDYNISLIYNNGSEEVNENGTSQVEANFNLVAPDDLHRTIHRLNMQTSVIEESEDNMKKKKSPTRVRIKSPYENKSHFIEEKKRKKLLEIREKREKRKIAMNESCKITKHKYGRGAIMPQSSNSVTKLSITNKSFYNSIYGESLNIINKNSRKYYTYQKLDNNLGIELEGHEENYCKHSPLTTPDKNSIKFINRSYYLDDADTEVMYLQMKQNEGQEEAKDSFTPSTSVLSTNDGINLNLLRHLITPSTADFSLTDTSSSLKQNVLFEDSFANTDTVSKRTNDLTSSRSTQVIVPTNTPKKEDNKGEENFKNTSSIDCRRSIDKIYHLLKKIGKADTLDVRSSKSKVTNHVDKIDITPGRGSSSYQASDSGTSIKHQLTSSNPSCFSFEKTNSEIKTPKDSMKIQEGTTSVTPKVIISSKLQSNKFSNKTIRDNKRQTPVKIQENPLKAISQLLHEFDSVQKMRHKNGNELKRNKKADILTTEDKSTTRQNSFKRTSKQDNIRDSDPVSSRFSFRERRRLGLANETLRISHQQFQTDKIDDIIDEVKELRGEAVRGPSKKLSRLNSLAQPKKAYVQAHHEEIQNKLGKRILSDKVHKLPMTPVSITERSMGSTCLKNKQRKSVEPFSASTSQQTTTASPSDRLPKSRLSANNCPIPEANRKRSPVSVRSSVKHTNVTNTPEPSKGKIAAVEAYVKSHYGRSHALEPCNTHSAHKSRVPLIPTDIDLVSLTSSRSTEEAAVLGKKLHYMIDSVIKTNRPVLSSLPECQESIPKLHKEGDGSFLKDISKCEEIEMSGSEYLVDIFEDKNIVTAVSNISKDGKDDESNKNTNANIKKCEIEQTHLHNDLLKLENVLPKKISNGTFQKRLRIKNLTLTPKQSMEKVFILQSGDSGSLVLKSRLSQNVDAATNGVAELKILPVLSNNCIDFGFTKFPMHIATVGYAFAQNRTSMTKVRFCDNDDTKLNSIKASENILNPTLNKSIQCFKGEDKNPTIKLAELEESDCCHIEKENPQYLGKYEEYTDDVQNKEQKASEDVGADSFDAINGQEIENKKSNISNSTSLDILVGLLNEIKKITSYQPHIRKHEEACTIDLESKELEIILDKAALEESSVDCSIYNEVSVTSLNNLQDLEARASYYSLNLSSNIRKYGDETKIDKNITTSASLSCQPISIDKGNAMIFQKEYVHRFTEAPSQFFPVTVSTNVTDSLIKLINKPSSQSINSFSDCDSLDNSISNKIIALPFKEVDKSIHYLGPRVFEIEVINDKKISADKLAITDKPEKSYVFSDFNPVMKMKRDILVTVYSILVLTVFAALSFPEIVYLN